MILRDYQEKSITELRRILIAGKKKPVMVLPTGAGKSVIFGQIINNVVEKGNRVLWLVHRRNLVYQMRDMLSEFDISPGLIMAGNESDTCKQVQLGTIQTYRRRLNLDDITHNSFYIDADIILIDEAHRSVSKQYKEIIDLYSDKIVIGCTATPMRADQRGLGEVYDSIVDIIDVKSLTEQEFLSPARYFATTTPDLSDVKIRMGDYAVKDLEKKTNTQKLNGDIVENWLKLGESRKTIVFCVNVKHSIAVCEQFLKNGIDAEHLEARSSDDEREAVFERMESGRTTVICNVGLYQEGLDVPDVSCIVMARPTKSLGLWRQCAGRGLRPSKLFEDCLVLDHGGVIEENGFLDEKIEWTLDGKEIAYKKPAEPKEKKKAKCTACGLVFEFLDKCPDCGSPIKTFGKKIETSDEDLKELKVNKKATIADKRRYLGMLKYWVSEKGYNPRMVNAKYKNYFKCWAHRKVKDVEPIKPDDAFLNLMRHDMIKFAKRKRA